MSVRRVIKPKKGIIRGQLVVLGLLDGVPAVVLADGVLHIIHGDHVVRVR